MCTALAYVRFGPIADMCGALAYVRFGPKADITRSITSSAALNSEHRTHSRPFRNARDMFGLRQLVTILDATEVILSTSKRYILLSVPVR
jgi:hypothetical protein